MARGKPLISSGACAGGCCRGASFPGGGVERAANQNTRRKRQPLETRELAGKKFWRRMYAQPKVNKLSHFGHSRIGKAVLVPGMRISSRSTCTQGENSTKQHRESILGRGRKKERIRFNEIAPKDGRLEPETKGGLFRRISG